VVEVVSRILPTITVAVAYPPAPFGPRRSK
jgi:hypothetical protein